MDFAAYSIIYVTALASVVLSVLGPVFMVRQHRRYMRTLTFPGQPEAPEALQPGQPQPDPGIAWIFSDDADPAAVARLTAELARPLPDLIAESERKAVAAANPLKGDPREAEVVEPPLTDAQAEVMRRRLLEATQQQALILPLGSTFTASGGDVSWTRQSGHCVPVMGPPDPQGDDHPLDSTGRPRTWIAPSGVAALNEDAWRAASGQRRRADPEVLTKLRHRRLALWEDAKFLADQACDQSRSFTGLEAARWDALHREMEVLDTRIRHIQDFLDSARL